MVTTEIRNAFEAKITEVMAKCQKFTTKTLVRPTLIFKQIGRTAGRASYRGTVTINPDFLKNHYDEQLNRTLVHELAHVFNYAIFGDRQKKLRVHGPEFFMVCGWCGLVNETRCHQMSTEGVKVKKYDRPFKYVCACNTVFMFTLRKHKKIMDGRSTWCRRCHQLTYVGTVHAGQFTPNTRPIIVDRRRKAEKPAPNPITLIVEPKIKVILGIAPAVTIKPAVKLVTRFIDGCLQNVEVPA
jgi:predicted SprT family Zn-dependent metalloprotease